MCRQPNTASCLCTLYPWHSTPKDFGWSPINVPANTAVPCIANSNAPSLPVCYTLSSRQQSMLMDILRAVPCEAGTVPILSSRCGYFLMWYIPCTRSSSYKVDTAKPISPVFSRHLSTRVFLSRLPWSLTSGSACVCGHWWTCGIDTVCFLHTHAKLS